MCGIAGIWHLNNQPLERDKLARFTDSLSHRGPDGAGYYIDQTVQLGLGHRRLSILDLSELGTQPMSFADERYWIVYNGEIFNFIELRKELEGKGYAFKGDSDTEVILAAWHCWGTDCLLKFNGMWSFAIWDKQEQTLFLSRDRFGIKPLYYLHQPGQLLAFASETFAFKYLAGFNRQVNEHHLAKVLQSTFSLEGYGHTIFRDIFQLLPGHYMLVKKGQPVQQRRWWNTLEHCVSVPEKYEDQVERFRELFESACTLRMRSDVPIASALSGGVDSSAVYCMLHQLMKKNKQYERVPADWQKAFIATFPGTQLDERQFADEVIRYINGNAVYVLPDYKNLVQKSIDSTRLLDGVIITPLFIVSDIYKAMSQAGIKVSMDGHGVDEMLLGYPHLVAAAYQQAHQSGDAQWAAELETTYMHLYPEHRQQEAHGHLHRPIPKQKFNAKEYFYTNFVPDAVKNQYRKLKAMAGSPVAQAEPVVQTPQLFSAAWLQGSFPVELDVLTDKPVDLSGLSQADYELYMNFHQTFLPSILRNFDRASMQSSIEVRMPFMDWRLVSYVFSLPLQSKIGGGYTKRILRDSMKDRMPETIRTRKLKIGLNAPMIEWFGGEMKEFLRDEVNSRSFRESAIWNGKEIAKFVDEKISTHSWQWDDCTRFWPYMNAHIIMNH